MKTTTKKREISFSERVMANGEVCLMNGLKTIAIEHIDGRMSVHDRLDTFEKRIIEKRRGRVMSCDGDIKIINLSF